MNADPKQRLLKIDQRALITNNDKKIFLVRESKELDWDLPGGLMLDRNNWRESLEFMIAELLDMHVIANNPVYACDYINPDSGEYIYVSFVQADAFKDEFNDEKYEQSGWFAVEEVGAMKFSTFDVKDAILSYYEQLARTDAIIK